MQQSLPYPREAKSVFMRGCRVRGRKNCFLSTEKHDNLKVRSTIINAAKAYRGHVSFFCIIRLFLFLIFPSPTD